MPSPDRYLVEMTAEREVPSLAGLLGHAGGAALGPRICHLLRASGPQGSLDGLPPEPTGSGALSTDVWVTSDSDIPWVTLVLGAECLDLESSDVDRAAILDEIFGSTLRLAGPPAGPEGATLVRKFALSLLADRLGPDAGAPAAEGTSTAVGATPRFGRWWPRFILVSALLNRVYFAARHLDLGPVSRWGDALVPLSQDGDDDRRSQEETEARKILQDTVEEAHRHVKRLREELREDHRDDPADPVDSFSLSALVIRIGEGLDQSQPVLHVSDIQGMTEVCWARMVQGAEVYPTWPELLVELSLAKGARGMRRGQPHPAFDNSAAASAALRRILGPVSKATDAGYRAGRTDNPRDEAYRQYADLLVAQAKLAASTRGALDASTLSDFDFDVDVDFDVSVEADADASPDDETPAPLHDGPNWVTAQQRLAGVSAPLAVAFVTTFDVELEMALCHHHPGQPFVVALPVHVVFGDRRASSLWLGYVVRPSEAASPLEAVTRPRAEDWFVLSSANLEAIRGGRYDGLELGVLPEDVHTPSALPFVVRLTGSPLVELPDFGRPGARPALMNRALEVLRVGREDGDASEASFGFDQCTHAVLLEEHQALRLSLPEIELKEGASRGLPRVLTEIERSGFRRFWLLLGVPLSDSVIRMRLMAQLMAAGLQHPGGTRYRHPLTHGMAVNRGKPGEAAHDMLQWLELKPAVGGIGEATPQLAHYVQHLTANPIGIVTWPGRDRECEVE